MPTKKPSARVVRGAKRRPKPPAFAPIPPGSMTDLELLPNLFRHFAATHNADFDWLKENVKAILERFDRIERRTDRNEERLGLHAQRLDDHEKRLSALEAQTPQTEARKGQEP